ncbi:MAG: hypothetical protein JWN76_2738 [Chitinophagaceae bacterium]|nr:hypothetical protein [Chitinophagaceae bacterium]
MKIFLLLLCISFSVAVPAQRKRSAKNTTTSQPAIFLDSVNIGNTIFEFDPDMMTKISVGKDDSKYPNGRIYITTKNPGSFHFLTMKEIIANYKIKTRGTALYMLDNEFIKDTSAFRIDSSYILKIVLIPGSDFSYLKKPGRLTIVKIIPRTKANLESQLRIRGDAFIKSTGKTL